MSDSIGEELRRRRDFAAKRVEDARSDLQDAMRELERLETALAVVEELSGNEPKMGVSLRLTPGQSLIYRWLPTGRAKGIGPGDLYLRLRGAGEDLQADYVRTTLWRMAQNGLIKSDAGKYWK